MYSYSMFYVSKVNIMNFTHNMYSLGSSVRIMVTFYLYISNEFSYHDRCSRTLSCIPAH